MANNLKDITEHFTWAEAVITNHRSIDNTLYDAHTMENVVNTATKLEKVRALFNLPLLVNSWYRCPLLNIAVGGAKGSDHLIGAAVDFIIPAYGTPAEVAKKIEENASLIRFKQLILEHTWVHISWDMIPNVNQKLEVLSLLSGGGYAKGLTNKDGKPLNA